MVDVTRTNFKSILENIKNEMNSCDYIAMDCEFSGLFESNCKNSADIPETRFRRCREDALMYIPVQVGLSFFTFDIENRHYIVKPYNFNIFPSPDTNFTCSANSMRFLASHNFDFDKWVYGGIPFRTVEKECEMVEKEQRRYESAKKENSSDDRDLNLVEAEKYQSTFLETTRKILRNIKAQGDEHEFHDLNSYERRLIFTLIAAEFSNEDLVAISKAVDDDKSNKQRYVLVKKDSVGSQKDYDHQNRIEEIKTNSGFTEVMKLISESGKMIVGHNMLMDALHVYNSFFGKVPEDYNEFKQSLTAVLPKLCDTKVLANTKPFKDHIGNTSLDQLFEIVGRKPFKIPKIHFPPELNCKYATVKMPHQAAYDSYMTGVIFGSLLNYLGSLIKPPRPYILASHDLVKPFINKLYLMNMIDIYYMDLDRDDEIPPRHNLFYLTFPKEWTAFNIRKLFDRFGNSTQINWLDDKSALVHVKAMNDVSETVIKTIRTMVSSDTFIHDTVTISSFRQYCESADQSEEKNKKEDLVVSAEKDVEQSMPKCEQIIELDQSATDDDDIGVEISPTELNSQSVSVSNGTKVKRSTPTSDESSDSETVETPCDKKMKSDD